ncbi:23020_t:CDS:2, partial [Gigaspora rosea]
EFKKFATSQDEKVFGKDQELLKTDARMWLSRLWFNGNNKQNIKSGIGKTKLKQKLETEIEKKIEHKLISPSNNKNSNPTSTNMYTVQTINTEAKKTTIQNLDCSEDASKLAKLELETKLKKTVYTFTLCDIPSEASPGRIHRYLNFYSKETKVRNGTGTTGHIAPKGAQLNQRKERCWRQRTFGMLTSSYLQILQKKHNQLETEAQGLIIYGKQEKRKAREQSENTLTWNWTKQVKEKRECTVTKDKEDLKALKELFKNDLNIQV